MGVVGPGLVTIVVNHGATEVVTDLGSLANVDDGKRIRWTRLLR